ncbi:LysR family transcriptional regulator [Calidifontibacter sp. DB0510]|uniref:LysR family transcriptional regulator n=1 Tax=Metallococcus carri TaxID=1656884 RepID=A0A967EAB4_9MICO|nr:LysR family transcriptional regulator [Metallococcus carri]NHN56100.1 LysR family transcriptional regulator [Metallococcus carri]NOP37443.1 LysR family transcriptional regulator [Calidifontibacter sp. DB2511S]
MRDAVHWLVVLAEEENVTAAADRLGLTQPTLSRMLARLERSLGQQLFDRQGRRITLNDKGRGYVDHVRRADAELALAEQSLRVDQPRVIRFGFLHSFGTWLVPALIGRARTRDPGLRFELVQGAADEMGRRVLDGSLDLAVVSPRPTDAALAWRLIRRQHLHLALPRDHPLAASTRLRMADLRGETFVGLEQGYGMRRLLDSACAAAGFEPTIAFECQELSTVAGLVGAGVGVALLPVEDAPHYPAGVVTVPLDGTDTARDIGVVWARRRSLPTHALAVRDLLRSS